MYSINAVDSLNFRGNGETAGSAAYLPKHYADNQVADGETTDNAIKKSSETSGSVAYRLAEQPKEDTVNFRGGEDYQENKKTPWLGILLGTALTGVAVIGALGYAHKANVLSIFEKDGFIKNTLTKCEPALKTCHEWCATVKGWGETAWEKVADLFSSKK